MATHSIILACTISGRLGLNWSYKVLVTQSWLTLCDPLDYSPLGYYGQFHRIFQARMLEWVAISFSRGSSWSRDQTCVPLIVGRFFTIWATRRANKDTNIDTCILIDRLLWWLSGKESTCQSRRQGCNPQVRKISWRRKWQPTPVFLPEKSHGQSSLVSYSPWAHKRVGQDLATKPPPAPYS